MVFKPSIFVVEPIGSGYIAVMAKPRTGEWIEDEFAGIAEYGVDRVVSLLEMDEAGEIGLGDESALCERNKMEFLSYPIPDRGLPASVVEFARVTRGLYETTAGGINTVVHCRAGIGRTGIVTAGVLLHAAIEPDAAFEHIAKARGVAVPDTDEQRQWVVSNQQEILNRDNWQKGTDRKLGAPES